MIPSIVHTVFGMTEDFGQKPFSLPHYLAVKSASIVNNGPELLIYYSYEPAGYWWNRAKQYATAVRIDPPEEIFGVPLRHPAHRTDIHKLMALDELGGIAMDLDVLCLRPFADLMNHTFVMAREEAGAERALCNAVMLAAPASPFGRRWVAGHDPERSLWFGFRSAGWDEHWGEMSTKYPAHLAALYPDELTILPFDRFFPYSWRKPDVADLFEQSRNGDAHESARKRVENSYCVHLWEMVSWDRYLRELTVEYINEVDTPFNLLARRFVADE